MRSLTIVFVLSITSFCSAQMRNALSDEGEAMLRKAKTAALLINIREPMAAPYKPEFDRAKKQALKKLAEIKDLQLISDPLKADIVIVVDEYNVPAGATGTGYSNGTYSSVTVRERICLADSVKVYLGGKEPTTSDAPIWTKSESCGFSWPLNRTFDAFKKARRKGN